MRLVLAVVVDTHEQEVAGVLCHLARILLAADLGDGPFRVLVVFQLQDDGGRIYILSRDEHDETDATLDV